VSISSGGPGDGSAAGAGTGPGTGGGYGGGTYRPGSGILPPRLLHEVKADYTEDGRRRGLSGDVVLEIVVRRDGSVGDVRVLHGLGAGLDERAVEAVRQWRFDPARRIGTPVDVIVEATVEFILR
jgi:TonB family protein